jgi:hypothetical protein
MMTRKDYRAIAAAIREAGQIHKAYGFNEQMTTGIVAEFIASTLEANSGLDINGNRKFDRDTFLKAAGVSR